MESTLSHSSAQTMRRAVKCVSSSFSSWFTEVERSVREENRAAPSLTRTVLAWSRGTFERVLIFYSVSRRNKMSTMNRELRRERCEGGAAMSTAAGVDQLAREAGCLSR